MGLPTNSDGVAVRLGPGPGRAPQGPRRGAVRPALPRHGVRCHRRWRHERRDRPDLRRPGAPRRTSSTPRRRRLTRRSDRRGRRDDRPRGRHRLACDVLAAGPGRRSRFGAAGGPGHGRTPWDGIGCPQAPGDRLLRGTRPAAVPALRGGADRQGGPALSLPLEGLRPARRLRRPATTTSSVLHERRLHRRAPAQPDHRGRRRSLIQLPLGLAIALLLNRKMRGQGVLRTHHLRARTCWPRSSPA